ncbi:L,D-transpeptidase family protein [Thalassotalea sp. PS06]|uniref:L,D-transpeptidase family protein n=1 Tax=Thalassotalea sp. PS06 TaxID=2594005 RepID=UPI001161F956|nr:L,D-transpeptidase family protein [Thalassotalea sp. PS06]QDP02071.1 L,D-transpeptidase family protein [Thalassotalea sp. PS06]
MQNMIKTQGTKAYLKLAARFKLAIHLYLASALLLSLSAIAGAPLSGIHSGYSPSFSSPTILQLNDIALPAGSSFYLHDSGIISRSHYQLILQKTGRSALWFESQGLSSSGKYLYRLLDDLGWLQEKSWQNASDTYQRDILLTQGTYFLLQSTQVNNNSGNGHELPTSTLISAFNKQQEQELLYRMLPRQSQFWRLRGQLQEFRKLAALSWPTLDHSFTPELGQAHPEVRKLRFILEKYQDLDVKYQTPTRQDVFDSVAIEALKRFQLRHGLKADGKLGPNSHMALAIAPQQRVTQLQINLMRWLQLPRSFRGNEILVNIPSYQLRLLNNGRTQKTMRVIVGNKENPTPVITSAVNRLTVNPTWTPTPKIIKDDLLEEYQRDFRYLQRKDFQLVRGYWRNKEIRQIDSPDYDLLNLPDNFRLVQSAGRSNPLGRYRFNMPNGYAIFLHDTPAKWHFSKPYRALSHGCIRLEEPRFLANELLKQLPEQNKHKQTMQSALQEKHTQMLFLEEPVPVYITYHTAWIDEQGVINFNRDIYGWDNKANLIAQFKTIISNPVITLSLNNL